MVRDWKRLYDLVLTLPALPIVVPLLVALGLVVRIVDGKPVFFVQDRVGRNKQLFRLVKLRTMSVGAQGRGPGVTSAGDARVTRVGRILRRAKLDELSQLWNVLRGEMSLVGPRPELAKYVDHYRAEWDEVFAVRPGLTDLASVVFRDEESVLAQAGDRERAYLDYVLPAKIELALEGVRSSNPFYDTALIVRTVAAVFGLPHKRSEQVFASIIRQIEQA